MPCEEVPSEFRGRGERDSRSHASFEGKRPEGEVALGAERARRYHEQPGISTMSRPLVIDRAVERVRDRIDGSDSFRDRRGFTLRPV